MRVIPRAMISIPYGKQDISRQDIQAVTDVLNSAWLTQGPAIDRFEHAVAEYCGVKYAVAVSNATAALHIACRALDLGPGGRLWTSPNSFVASANCGIYTGAAVNFVDIDPRTYNLSVAELRRKLERAAEAGALPSVVVPVHFGGQPCDMAEIGELARQYGFRVIEDASHAIGAGYGSGTVGNCAHSDVTVFSLHPVKIITTGEGGLALTNDERLYRRLRRLRTHGITREDSEMTQPSEGPWYYEQVEMGHNFRMTDLQAALGASQLTRLDSFVARRRELAERYGRLLQGLAVILPEQAAGRRSAWHLYPIQVAAGIRRAVVQSLRGAGVLVNVHYIPIHLQPVYRQLGFSRGDFPAAEAYYAGAISLPLYSALTDVDQDYVVARLTEALQ
jgi:UDP-4-amino-4,6-dideoxy-N-acetyl-beta-L-altrosamine transaminase